MVESSDRRHRYAVIVLAVVCIALTCTAVVTAQQSVDEQDTFEDGNVDGWVNNDTGIQPSTSSTSVEGSVSLFASTSDLGSANVQDSAAFEWRDGPRLDISEGFDITATFQTSWGDVGGGSGIRIGLSGASQVEDGENAFLIINKDEGRSYLATSTNDTAPSSAETSTVYEDSFYHLRLNSEEGSDELRAKVWSYGSQEPTGWQLTLDGLSGVEPAYFGVNVGNQESAGRRNIWLDSVRLEGTTYVNTSGNIRLDIQGQMDHGSTQPYQVYDRNKSIGNTEVTEEASVTSSDPSIISVNETAHTLTATNDTSVAQRVQITATVDGETAVKNVTVANVTLANIHILPNEYWIEALITDSTIQWTFLSSLFGALVGRLLRNPWAAIGTIEALLLIGWIGAWVTTGLMATSVFSLLAVSLTLMQVRKKRT